MSISNGDPPKATGAGGRGGTADPWTADQRTKISSSELLSVPLPVPNPASIVPTNTAPLLIPNPITAGDDAIAALVETTVESINKGVIPTSLSK